MPFFLLESSGTSRVCQPCIISSKCSSLWRNYWSPLPNAAAAEPGETHVCLPAFQPRAFLTQPQYFLAGYCHQQPIALRLGNWSKCQQNAPGSEKDAGFVSHSMPPLALACRKRLGFIPSIPIRVALLSPVNDRWWRCCEQVVTQAEAGFPTSWNQSIFFKDAKYWETGADIYGGSYVSVDRLFLFLVVLEFADVTRVCAPLALC